MRDAHVPDVPLECFVRQSPQDPGRARGIAMGGQEAAHLELGIGAGGDLPINLQQMLSEPRRRVGLLDLGNRDRQSLGGRPLLPSADVSGKTSPRRLPCTPRIFPLPKNDIQQPHRRPAGAGPSTIAPPDSGAISESERGERRKRGKRRKPGDDRVWRRAPEGHRRAHDRPWPEGSSKGPPGRRHRRWRARPASWPRARPRHSRHCDHRGEIDQQSPRCAPFEIWRETSVAAARSPGAAWPIGVRRGLQQGCPCVLHR